MRNEFDVDIDVKPSTDRESYGTRAMVYNEDTCQIKAHPAGFYVEPVPIDPYTGCAAFDYKYGSRQGFMKIDLLTNTTYSSFKTKQEVLDAIEAEPDWSLLHDPEVVAKLPHIGKHFELVEAINPTSVEELADTLALIRPGKSDLLADYLEDRNATRRRLYRAPNNKQNYFKKAHAFSYAVMIVAAMYKIKNQSGIEW